MVKTIKELLGEQLIEHDASNNGIKQISTDELNGKSIALYFGFICY